MAMAVATMSIAIPLIFLATVAVLLWITMELAFR
jgi:hypothetical protein